MGDAGERDAVVLGTPAYAREFTLGDSPADLDDLDPWVQRNVLDEGRPLVREARFLLAEEPDLRDTALYNVWRASRRHTQP
ncbi:hypothetical protein [Embleya hyalina]|uniref:hypothetical protein n=1 Tax=Embleya hyalina TaxID=516124 RepID=UPI0027D964BE|nr:hypothetical protein [Embleya hyalina]